MNDEPKPQNALYVHLTADFMTPENRQIQDDPNINSSSLQAFVARMTSPEDIEKRMMSDESARLGVEVEGLLEGAHITDNFRDYIVNTVRQAHAMEDSVAEEISPERLGLNTPGQSIFDEEAAPEIEARCLREYMYIVARKHLRRIGPEDDKRAVIMNSDVFSDLMAGVGQWQESFIDMHDADPFEGVDTDAYELAGQDMIVVDLTSETGMDGAYNQFIEGLKASKDPRENEETSE